MAANKGFNWRNFTSFMVTAAFLVSVVSGIVLYVVPEGRIANWVDWNLVGMTKPDWGNLHIVFALVFLIGGIFHLFVFNWASFKAYLARRVSGKLDYRKPRREMMAALTLSLALTVASIAEWQPVAALFDLNAAAKAAWVTSPELEPPFGHAEDSSLAGLARKMGIDLPAAMAALKEKGIAIESAQKKMVDIAHANGISPMALYAVVRPLEPKPEASATKAMTAEDVDVAFGGTGVGRKTLRDVLAMTAVPEDLARTRLGAAGLAADLAATLKDIASARDLTPMDVLKVIVVDGHRI